MGIIVSARARRIALCLAATSVGAVIAATGGIAPAFATTVVQVGTASALEGALTSATPHTFIDLTADIDTSADGAISVPASVSVDLEGFALTTDTIAISSGATLRILDSDGGGTLAATSDDGSAGIEVPDGAGFILSGGTIVAQGAPDGAGIGGDDNTSAVGTISIQGGSVTATGGAYGAGIGGGYAEGAGDVEISGGSVTAIGGSSGAGIGTGSLSTGDPGDVIVSGGTVNASGGAGSAGIGGAVGSAGGILSIGSGAVVTASSKTSGNAHVSAIGGGSSTGFTSLDISGTVNLPTGQSLIIPSGSPATVHASGVVTGVGATVTGSGTLVNDGTLTVSTVNDVLDSTPGTLTVSDNDYLVTFDSNATDATPASSSNRIYAASLSAAGVSFPAVTRSHWELTQWSDGDGNAVTTQTPIQGDDTVSADWGFSGLSVAAAAGSTPTIDDTTTFVATGLDASGAALGDHTADVTFISSNADDSVDGAGVTFASVGQRTITATSKLDSAVVGTLIVTVKAGALASIVTSPLALSVTSGTSRTFTTTGYDAHDNSLGTVAATYTSSNSSDVVSASTASIKFVNTGSRVITAHSGGFTTTADVTVTPGSLGSTSVKISGTKSYDHTLTAKVTAASVSGKMITYKWYRGSSAISGATKSTHKIGKSDLGHSLHVKVTISAKNYTTATATSSSVSISKDSPSLSIAVPSSFKVGTASNVTVMIAAGKTGVKPTGTVTLYVNGKSYSSLKIGASTGLQWMVPVKIQKAETVVIYAQYAGSSTYASKKSSTKTVKAK